ncbi:MAG: ABC transporter ATP-binding protein [Fretibacterium sp.]|nr:ABC transporter ATP-binding protein [Fretibacterium sp.]
MNANKEKLLDIKDLVIRYETDDGVVAALNSVTLSLMRGRTLGVVGEGGAGKTTLAKGILRLIPAPPGRIVSGQVLFEGQDLLRLSETEMRRVRGQSISMIFQDPMTSLNPVMTVGDQIMEVIQAHKKLSRRAARTEAAAMLETVGIPSERASEYPHQFSGGMRQRVGIAIALACSPALLIADEPTTALDVTIQAQVLDMIRELKTKLNTSVMLITHDLGVVAQNCDAVAILYAGTVMEYGTLRDVFKDPRHPYTLGLLGSIPSLDTRVDRLRPIKGLMPDPTNLPPGCPFSPRCPHCSSACVTALPDLVGVGGEHTVRCVLAKGGAL